MELLHRWPILILAFASAAGIVILLWILFNFLRESRSSKDTSPKLGTPRNPRR
ncbi:MAG TPA: hypothetical protein VME18_11275 [Acidobacteriaceae bacterium]|nr:hypothetical protein [Acidobacteriaceae bacterium]